MAPSSTLTGDIRFHHALTFPGHAPRDVAVYLPPGYETDPSRRYPVLYLQDGQNLLDCARAYSGAWEVDDTAESLIGAGVIAPVIIVAVGNAGAARIHEYTPVPTAEHGGGGAGGYADYMARAIKPWVDATYRTRPEAQWTGVGGSSLGALASIETVRRYPDTFGRLALLSPSVWWADRHVLETIRTSPRSTPLPKLWLSTGTDEGRDPARSRLQVQETRALRDALYGAGWATGPFAYHEIPGAAHCEAAWGMVIGDVLATLYPATEVLNPPDLARVSPRQR